MQPVEQTVETNEDVKVKSIRKETTSGARITYDINENPVHIDNALDARGVTCSGTIMKQSNNYRNTILIKNDTTDAVHVIHKSQLDVELEHPNRKRDSRGNVYNAGGFEQPLEPVGDENPRILQTRRTGFN